MATNIRLEINRLEILKKREKWELYFLVVTQNPEDHSQSVYTVMPSKYPIKLTKMTDNVVQFKPEGNNTEGLFILERPMPEDHSISVTMYLMQSRGKLRKSGEIMENIAGSKEAQSLASKVVKTLGKSTPWMAIGTAAGQGVGKILSGIKDRQLGYISLDEGFSGDAAGSNDRKNRFASGFAELEWSWFIS